jgi:hypothetical protein
MKLLPIAAAGATLAFGGTLAVAQGMQYSAPAQERKIEAPKDAPKAGTAAAVSAAISVEQPKPKCEDPGAFPGRVGMQTEDRRNKFIRALESYKTCMMGFVEERKAVIKANETAARGAIDEFNAKMKKYQEEQEKARE